MRYHEIIENDEEDMFGQSDRVGNDLRRATYRQRIPGMIKMIHGGLEANAGSLVKQIAAELGRDADVFRRDPEIFDLANELTSEIAAQVSNILMNLDPVMINDEDALNNALSDYAANIRAESDLWNYIEEVLGDDAELDDSYACAMTIEGEIGALLLKLIQQAYNQFSLAETFDKPYKGKWEKSDYGDVDLNTKLPDGTNLNIMFNQEFDGEHTVTQVEFHRNNSQDVTGEGDAQRIFATVLDAIQKYIKKYKPEKLSFSASKQIDMDADDVEHFNPESRAKLYTRLVQRYAGAWGYQAQVDDNGDVVIYQLTRTMAEDVPQPGPSSGAPKQFGPDAKIETRQMTVKEIIASVPGLPYYNNVVDDYDAKDHSWGVTQKVIEYATYLKEHPESLAKLPPILVLNGKFEDGAHRVSAIWLLQQRMDRKNPLWANAKLSVQFVKQGVAEGRKSKIIVKPSPGKGNGLFANKLIKAGEVITSSKFEYISDKDWQLIKNTTPVKLYGFKLGDKHALQSGPFKFKFTDQKEKALWDKTEFKGLSLSGFMFVNGADSPDEVNSKERFSNNTAEMIATQDIQPGQEIIKQYNVPTKGVAEGEGGLGQVAGIGINGKQFNFSIKDLIAKAQNYPVKKLNPQLFVKQLADRHEDPKQTAARAQAADLQYPIIVVQDGDTLMIADGTHRAQKAIMNKLPSINAHVIPVKDMAEFGKQGVAEEQLDELKIDNRNGKGAVPHNQDVDYFGLRVKMKPSMFLKLALPLNVRDDDAETIDHLAQVKDTEGFGAPFLDIKFPKEWFDGDVSIPARVAGHDGRHRMLAILKSEGDDPVEVHLFPRGGVRGRDITDEMIKALEAAMVSQSGAFVRGPIFGLEHAHLDEAGNGLIYRGYPCTKDCSGHIAGHMYADYWKITDPDMCPYGNSNSFWEGCRSASEEQ